MLNPIERLFQSLSRRSVRAIWISVAAIYAHSFLEWLFFVTKPSYFVLLTIPECLSVLALTPVPFLVVFLPLVALGNGLAAALAPMGVGRLSSWISSAVPAFLIACILLVLIDNFTYTVLKIGVTSSQGALRGAYGLLFVALIVLSQRKLVETADDFAHVSDVGLRAHLVAVAFLISLSALAVAGRSNSSLPDEEIGSGVMSKFPDIFLISADGSDTSRMGVYECPRDTTPFLSSLHSDWFRFENHFPNLNRTSGSMASILTGKHGTTTHKLHSAHVFKGRDSFEHLPGFLRGLGYKTIQLGWRHHVDARHWNMSNAFDVVNISSTKEGLFDRIAGFNEGRFALTMHFVGRVVDRIQERLQHAFGGPMMVRSHKKDPDKITITSHARVDRFFNFLETHPGPVFAQLHLDRTKTDVEMIRFDQFLRTIMFRLQAIGRYESSVIVILTDHGEHYAVSGRVPLLVRFPTAVDLAPVTFNTQNLDLAPTLIDYLGFEIPDWMEGRSLLRSINPLDPIIGISSHWDANGIPVEDIPSSDHGGPTDISLTVCQRNYSWNFETGKLTSGIVPGHTSHCEEDQLPTLEQAGQMLAEHMRARAYAVKE